MVSRIGRRTHCADESWTKGYCQETWSFAGGNCQTDTVGHWPRVRTADRCVAKCLECDNCAFVTHSRSENNCDWFSFCERPRQARSDHCTLAVRPKKTLAARPVARAQASPERALEATLSYCPHSGFANQLYELLAASVIAESAGLVLRLRPILQRQTYWLDQSGATSGCDVTKIADFQEMCSAPGWTGGSTVAWPAIIEPQALPCLTATTGGGPGLGPVTHRHISLAHIGTVCNSGFGRHNSSCSRAEALVVTSLARTIGRKRIPLSCLRRLVANLAHHAHASPPPLHFSLGSTFEIIEGLMDDARVVSRHVSFSPGVTHKAAALVRGLRSRGGGTFWCAHARVGQSTSWDADGSFFQRMFETQVSPALREWSASGDLPAAGLVATDNRRALMAAVPELCRDDPEACLHDGRLTSACAATGPRRCRLVRGRFRCSSPPDNNALCRAEALAAVALACAHATSLFLSGGSTFSRLILDLHTASPSVIRDAAFKSARRSVTISGRKSQFPFGGHRGMSEMRRQLHGQGGSMLWPMYRQSRLARHEQKANASSTAGRI